MSCSVRAVSSVLAAAMLVLANACVFVTREVRTEVVVGKIQDEDSIAGPAGEPVPIAGTAGVISLPIATVDLLVSNHSPEPVRERRATGDVSFSCPLPIAAQVSIETPSGATLSVDTDASGRRTFDLPEAEPAGGVVRGSLGKRSAHVRYFKTAPAALPRATSTSRPSSARRPSNDGRWCRSFRPAERSRVAARVMGSSRRRGT